MSLLRKIWNLKYLNFMRNLSQKLDEKKEEPLFKQTTLTDKDKVYLDSKLNFLFLVRDDDLYRIEEIPSKIDPLTPVVFYRRLGKARDGLSDECQPYGKIKNSLK